jgi:hypothetical protein
MREILKDARHLLRAAALFLALILVFLLARGFLVPKDFGTYGHYRAGALDDNRSRPPAFAGMKACEDCHADVVESRKGSKHSGVRCEACHGPQAAHAGAEDPSAAKPARPDPRGLCLRCHEENVARPAGFPQVNAKDHGGGEECHVCHKPHHPEVS